MKDILVIGGGKIGSVVAALLVDTPEATGYRVTVADRSAALLAQLTPGGHPRLNTLLLDVADPIKLRDALQGRFAVLSAAPYHLTLQVAQAARDAGVHYLDLTEDVASTRAIRALADGATTAFIPQCGLAPGFISIVAADLARRFDSLDSVRMRVGALPAYPSNALNYRTIRYPGHAAIMKALLHDLRLRDRRDVLKDILEQALPATMQDVVIVFVTVAGQRGGRLQQETYARKIYSHVLAGQMRSAIQITTASSLCAMLDLLAAGELPQSGFVRQEEVPLEAFLGNRFGRVYAADALAHAA